MSWSVNGTVNANSAAEDLGKLREVAISQNAECGDQFDAAAKAVADLLSTGVVGGPDKSFHCNLVGHANPGHESREGWANDLVNISISQV